MKKLIKKFEGGGGYSNADMYKKAYDKLKSLGYPPEMLDITTIRNLGGVDAIMSSSFNQRYISPKQRLNQEIEAAGGLEAWLKLKRNEAWNSYQRNKRASREQGDVAADERKMTPEEAKAVYDYNMRVLLLIADQYNNAHVKTAKQRTTTKTQSTQKASTTKSTNTQTANQGFDVKAFQNWVLQRNKFNNSKGFTNGNYSLGKWGVDGIMGRYTRNAYNALKNEYNMWLKSGMNNYGLFYNKYVYKNPQDISDRMADDNEMIIQKKITMTPEQKVQSINGLPVPPEYTHDDWIRERMSTMNSYNTTPTSQEINSYYSRPSDDMINIHKTTAFAFGGRLIPKYQNGSAYLKVKDDENYWNNYLANTGYKPVYNENSSTWDDYYKLYGKAFFDKLYNLFGGEVPREAFITNPLVNTARKRNFSIWWKNNNFGAMLPSALKSEIKYLNMIPFINISIPPYEGNDTLYHLSDPHSYRSGYDGSSGHWIKKGDEPNKKSNELLNPHLHKKGGIIKAAQGWRIEKDRLIVKQQGNEFFVNPEGFYVNGSGHLMARAYTSNGKQFDIPITTFDRNRLKLLGVNYIPRGEKKVTIVKSTYEAPSPNNGTNKNNTIPKNNTTSEMDDNQLLEALKVLFNPILEQLNNRPSWYNGFNPQAGKNYTLKDGQMVEVTKPEEPTEPDKNAAPALTSKAPSYQDLQTQNTQAFLNNSKNPHWRKNFRQNFMSAFNSGTLYNANNPEAGGNQVFDLLGMNAADIMGNERYWNDNKGGLYRGGMRRLARDYRKGRIGNGDIATKKNAFLAEPANNGGPALTNVDPSIVGVNVNAMLDSSTNYENAYAESLKWNQAYYGLMQLKGFPASDEDIKNSRNPRNQ